MPVLDRNQPYGQVYGEPGIYWQQNGHRFRFDGTSVDEGTAPEPVAAEAKRSPGRPPKLPEPSAKESLQAIYSEVA